MFMNTQPSLTEIEQALAEIPLFDVHTHLIDGHLAAKGLHDVLLYHMLISELYAAGCPSGTRLTSFPRWPSREEACQRIEEAIPYLPYTRNTSMSWLLRYIMAELYDWHEPVTLDNWQKLDGMICERSEDRDYAYSILDRAKIVKSCAEYARRGNAVNRDRLFYSLEWGFFSRSQWGEFDTALFELERCWGHPPEESPMAIGGKRPPVDRQIRSVDDVFEAVQYYVSHIPYDKVISMATHISTDIDFHAVSSTEMAAALKRRDQAGFSERDIYASFVNEVFLSALESHADDIIFQFSFGAEPLPHETGSRLSPKTIRQVAEMIARHPRLRFQCFLSNLSANQSMCTLVRELPNLTLVGYWWHNFFPGAIQQVMDERLDMLPLNRQVAFFSDAYYVEWSYAKAFIVRKELAQVLQKRIQRGQYTLEEALSIARAILYETPVDLIKPTKL
jgi:glucuronate isomerase